MPTQLVIPPGSVNEYQSQLGSKGVYHVMHWPWSHSSGWCQADGQ